MIKRMLWLMMILMICLNGISMAEETTIHSVTTLAVGETVKLDETIISIEDISDISGDLFEATDNDIP